MMSDIKQKTRTQRIAKFIAGNKFLADKKHHKNILISLAAYGSWAARGQAGGCSICNANYYNCSFQHKRFTTKYQEDTRKEYHWNSFGSMCSNCYEGVEKQCKYKFMKH